jgi:ADP-L-glycero-D-manno-heptose 6-epimerase
MYIVTGGAGFIGSNLVKGLNARGISDILVVDNLASGQKFLNLVDLDIADYCSREDFNRRLTQGLDKSQVQAVFHQGACSNTMEYDGRFMMDNNYQYSKNLLHFCLEGHIPFVYASSAAVYGSSTVFREEPACEGPLNIYGYSKLLFDRYVQRLMPKITSGVVGLRYFNVYGPGEGQKGRMASMVHQLYHQLRSTGKALLFEGSGGYGDGEQRRDFVAVEDIVAVNFFFEQQRAHQGIYNVGTGQSRSFNAIARTLINQLGAGEIVYQPMPEVLKDKYQNFTQADIGQLRGAGYTAEMTSLEKGIAAFLEAQPR